MQKTKLLLPFLTFSAVSLLIIDGCSKKDSNNSSGSITVNNLAGTYKITSYQETEQGQTYDPQDPCEKDDLEQFNTDLTYLHIDAGTSCTPSGNESGTWKLSGNYLIATDSYGTDTATINSFNGKTLVFTTKGIDGTDPYTDVITLTKQ